MHPGIGRAILVTTVTDTTDIPGIMEQRGGYSGKSQIWSEIGLRQSPTIMPVQQSGHGKRHIKHMLHVVIANVTGIETGKKATVQATEIFEQGIRGNVIKVAVASLQYVTHSARHRLRI
jgi:hypothetical protein